jgi:hypothetical protein
MSVGANHIVNGTGNEQWDRLPGRGYYFGLSRPYVYGLIKEGKIKTALIKTPGKCRGMRLIWRPSVLAFIEKHVQA